MVIEYWLVAILFWQLSINHIENAYIKDEGLQRHRLRHPSLPFVSLSYPTRTICKRVRTYVRTYVRTLGQSRDNQTKRGWPYSMSMGLCPTRASRAREPRYEIVSRNRQIFEESLRAGRKAVRMLRTYKYSWKLLSILADNLTHLDLHHDWAFISMLSLIQ